MRTRGIVLAVVVSTIVAWSGVANAQGPGGPGGGLSPEKRDAAIALQAGGVAKSLGLSPELTIKLTDAYKASRKSHQEALEKMSGEGEDGRARFQAAQKVSDDERAKLKTAVEAFLDADQTTKAVAALGTFNRQVDRYFVAVGDLKLDAEKQQKALELINAYVIESDAARAKAMASGDMQGVRAAMEEARGKLDKGMEALLTPEQLTAWKEATARRGGGGGGGGGRRDRGRDDGNPPAGPPPAGAPPAPAGGGNA